MPFLPNNAPLGAGFSETPSQEDNLEIASYIAALNDFILQCDTPMTIAIQGDWGTGKTTVMQILQNELRKHGQIRIVNFNAWRHSQFRMENAIAVSLLQALMDECDPHSKFKKQVEFGLKALRVVLSVPLSLAAIPLPHDFKAKLDNPFAGRSGGQKMKSVDDLRTKFQRLIGDTLKNGQGRFVVFIDDLDRLDPQKALETLEVLTLFLDCKGCVFVLAVDMDIVKRGVRAKYRVSKDDDDISERVSERFFEKIIQLPFRLPVEEYNIDSFLDKKLDNLLAAPYDEQTRNIAQDLLCGGNREILKRLLQFVDTNPRTLKQLLNTLLFHIYKAKADATANDSPAKKILKTFAMLCLSLSDEKLYDEAVGAGEGAADIFKKRASDNTDAKLHEFYETLAALYKDDKDIAEYAAKANMTSVKFPELTDSFEIQHFVTPSEAKYGYIAFGKQFNIGLGQPVFAQWKGNAKTRQAKRMHKSQEGRLDGLTKFWNENGVSDGKTLTVSFNYKDKTLTFSEAN